MNEDAGLLNFSTQFNAPDIAIESHRVIDVKSHNR
jgi:hypothetical protein